MKFSEIIDKLKKNVIDKIVVNYNEDKYVVMSYEEYLQYENALSEAKDSIESLSRTVVRKDKS